MKGEVIGYAIVMFLIICFTYGLVRQIQHTLSIQKANETAIYKYRRTLVGNYIVCVSFLGFLISYVLNILVAIPIIQSTILTSDTTALSCFLFLVVLLIAKFGVIPKKHKPKNVLN